MAEDGEVVVAPGRQRSKQRIDTTNQFIASLTFVRRLVFETLYQSCNQSFLDRVPAFDVAYLP